MKKRYLISLIALILLAVSYFYYLRPLFYIYVGFAAKTVCSCHFLQGRSLEDIRAHELTPATFIGAEIDDQQQQIDAAFLGVKRTAVYRPGMGCTLLSERLPQDLPRTQPQRTTKGRPTELPIDLDRYPGLSPVLAKAFEEPFADKAVNTRAVLVVKDSTIVGERYAPGFDKNTPQMGWSMAKSVTNALVGILVREGKLDVFEPAQIEDWHQNGSDNRQAITLDHLLRMSSGLYFEEDYGSASTVNRMLWTKADAGKEAYQQSLQHPVDSVWYYSSGTSNIIGHIIRNQFPDYQSYINFPYQQLYDKLGMNTVVMETDANGTFVGSSLIYASARDWAKFGQLYLQDGVWNGERILPPGWVTYTRTRTPNLAPYHFYGAHWWINALEEPPAGVAVMKRKWEGVPVDAFYASGFEGQTVLVVPSENVVIVRLGQTLDRSAWDMGAFAAEVLTQLTPQVL